MYVNNVHTRVFPTAGLKSIQTASLNFCSKVKITFGQQQWMFHPQGDAQDLRNQGKDMGRWGALWKLNRSWEMDYSCLYHHGSCSV